MAPAKAKKTAIKKVAKKEKLKGTPIEVILKAAEDLKKSGVDLSYLLK